MLEYATRKDQYGRVVFLREKKTKDWNHLTSQILLAIFSISFFLLFCSYHTCSIIPSDNPQKKVAGEKKKRVFHAAN